ncbi:MAG: glutamate--tRNA ligase [Candidatus Doudnabacteria bacterium]|nr:glutamate--tRNA ligase [Candidatus Doudnabacteria bacterium]
MAKVRTRFAPSPTGFLHVGGLRTALFAFLFARKNNGEFVLRIEDTDKARTVEGAAEGIITSLKEFGLNFDDGPIFQSERLSLYKKYAEELVSKGDAYYCFCTPERLDALRKGQEAAKHAPKYDKHCLNLAKDEIETRISSGEPHVIRLNVPAAKTIRFTDLVHGEISISSNDLDDQVLLKSDGYPTYHLAVVVDDHDMNITHVIRGEEWIPSTPKHILLYSAFGWESPQHAHLPLLLSKTKKKLSKRDGDVAVKDYLEKGYLPEAMLNFVAFLGWNPKTEQEVFSLGELIEVFGFDKVNKSGAVFDLDKLDWINGLYIRKLTIEDLFARISRYLTEAGIDLGKYPQEFIFKVLNLERERLKKFSEIGERVQYFFKEPEYGPALLIWKKGSREGTKTSLAKLSEYLKSLDQSEFNTGNLESKIKSWIAEDNLTTGEVLWPLRVALSGLAASPGPFEIMDAFGVLPEGKEIILKRIQNASNLL